MSMPKGQALQQKRVVVIGGGTGTYTVLSGLKKYDDVHPTAIVSMADDGGSTGVLRDELGVLPPGDVRRSLVALSESEKTLRDLFNYRFRTGKLEGHSFGNLFLAALEGVLGRFDHAVEHAAKILRVRGSVIPVTLDDVRLSARLEDGTIVRGETNIDIPKHDGSLRIEEVFLKPQARAYRKAREAIAEADRIVIGPGDLFTSVIPNLLVSGIREAIRGSSAKKVYIVNVMTKFGETHDFQVQDFVAAVEKYLGNGVLDYVLYNTARPSPERLKKYAAERAEFVAWDDAWMKKHPAAFVGGNFLRDAGLIRHHPDRLAKAILDIV